MIRASINQSRLKGGQRLPMKLIEKTLRVASRVLRVRAQEFVSLAFLSAQEMKRMNRIWRHKNTVTDVLSFELSDGSMIGEILICYDQARAQAKDMKHSTRDELVFLLVHGLLHLKGYDHEKARDKEKMFALQTRILKSLNIDSRV